MADDNGSQITDGAQANTDGGGGGTSNPSFHDSLPEGIRGHESLKGFQDAGTLAQSYLDLQGKVPVIPESPDGYKLDLQGVSKESMGAFTKWAHETGLSQAQVDAFVKLDRTRSASAQEAAKSRAKAKLEADKAQLQKDWGDDFKAHSQLAEKAMKMALGDENLKAWKKAGLLNNLHVVKFFKQLGEIISEDAWVAGRAGKPTSPYKNEYGEGTLAFPNTPNMKG